MSAENKHDSHHGVGHHHSSSSSHGSTSHGSTSHFSNQDNNSQFSQGQNRPIRQETANQLGRFNQCGKKNTQGINGRIAGNTFIDGDSEFGELKKPFGLSYFSAFV